MQITLEEARRITVISQRLNGKAAVIDAMEHLGYVQIDTLAVMTRAHHHTLWSRCSSCREKSLDKLLKEKRIFEYRSHAASYFSMNDYRFSLPRKPAYKLTIDFGPVIGKKRSSARLVHYYKKEEPIGKRELGVVNFAPRQIGPFVSDVAQWQQPVSDFFRLPFQF